MTDDKFETYVKNYPKICPDEIKAEWIKDHGFTLSNEEFNDLWISSLEDEKRRREDYKQYNHVVMYTSNGVGQINKAMNIMREIAEISGSKISFETMPIDIHNNPDELKSMDICGHFKCICIYGDNRSKHLLDELSAFTDNMYVFAEGTDDIKLRITLKDVIAVKRTAK